MAQKVQVLLTCDLDDDDVPAVETVTFGYDGATYAFELCEAHLEEFGNVMNGYIGCARRAEGGPSRRARSSSSGVERSARPARQDLSAVREWARENGYEVSARGRIPTEIREAYEAAQK
ncbi:MAG TPA: Lsr2 family protein [Acidimicrobiales bacterium]|nr:Lsr2 family protein [Acidimicrobiales bacterium]